MLLIYYTYSTPQYIGLAQISALAYMYFYTLSLGIYFHSPTVLQVWGLEKLLLSPTVLWGIPRDSYTYHTDFAIDVCKTDSKFYMYPTYYN